MRSVAISAGLAQRPFVGGHTWFALQYLIGFRELGWDVVLVDRVEPGMSADVSYLARAMRRFDLDDSWAVLVPGDEPIGMSRRELERRLRASELLINVMGYLDDPELLALTPLRVFLDIDPGFGQMWRALGLHDAFSGHDRFVTVGLNVGRKGCRVPDCGLAWIPSLPPVVLRQWPVTAGRDSFTTVASWRGPFGPVEFGGRTYGLRVHELRRFVELPRATGAQFELALDIDPADAADIERLRAGRWTLVDPRAEAADPSSYRDFIQRSGAELSVAKNMYVDTRSGWFSDRSACYLASGKPVLAQDTGFGTALPTGAGLLSFATFEEAAGGVEEISSDRKRHARAAREIAEEYLASDRVLGHMLSELGVA